MAYCTLEDILAAMDEDEVIRYTDDSDSGAIDTVVVDEAIADSDAMVDSYLAARYAVPMTPVPPLVKGLARDIAVYKICTRRGTAPDAIRTKFEDAEKFLSKLAAGRVVVPGADLAPSGSSRDTVQMTSDTRVFSRSGMRGF